MNQENTDDKFSKDKDKDKDKEIFFENFKQAYELLKQQEEEHQNIENKSFEKKYSALKGILILLFSIAIFLSGYLLYKKQPYVSIIPIFIGVIIIFDTILDLEYFKFPKLKQHERSYLSLIAKAIPIFFSLLTGIIFICNLA